MRGAISISTAALDALRWLIDHNGDGGFETWPRHCVLCAAGEEAPVMRGTWKVLAGVGLVEFYHSNKRLRVTEAGRAALAGARRA